MSKITKFLAEITLFMSKINLKHVQKQNETRNIKFSSLFIMEGNKFANLKDDDSNEDYEDSNSENEKGNRFAGLMDSSEDYEDDEEPQKTSGNRFAGLMSSSDDDECDDGEEEEKIEKEKTEEIEKEKEEKQTEIKTNPNPPPPSTNSSNYSNQKKTEIDIDAEFLELAKAQTNKNQTTKEQSKNRNEKQNISFTPNFNIGKELYDRFQDQTFSEYYHLPKKAHPSRFIHRVKSWPHTIPSYFTYRESGNNNFELNLTDYAKSILKRINALGEHGIVSSDPFFFKNLIYGMIYNTTQREFTKATESALMLTYVLQQAVPTNFIYGKSKYIADEECSSVLGSILRFLGMYAFRRGCYTTAYTMHRFLFETIPDSYEGQHILYTLAGTSLYAGELNFIKSLYERKDLKIDGITLDKFPEWRICYAIACNDDKMIIKEMGLWRHVFYSESTPESDSDSLTRLQLAAGKRLSAYLNEKPFSDHIKELKKSVVEEDRKEFQNAWKDIKFGETNIVEMWVEELMFPIAS